MSYTTPHDPTFGPQKHNVKLRKEKDNKKGKGRATFESCDSSHVGMHPAVDSNTPGSVPANTPTPSTISKPTMDSIQASSSSSASGSKSDSMEAAVKWPVSKYKFIYMSLQSPSYLSGR